MEKNKGTILNSDVKASDKKAVVTRKARIDKDIEVYDLENVDADLEYTRRFDNVKDLDIKKKKTSKNVELKKKKGYMKKKRDNNKLSINDIKVLICGILYLVSAVLLIIGVIKYFNFSSMKVCTTYLMISMFLVVIATVLVSVEFGNKNVKTILGVSINNKLPKKKRVGEYFKEAVFISLIVTTFIAILIASDSLFIDFYKLTQSVTLNVILIFMFMYVIIFILCYLGCYFYSEHKISKQ